MSCNGESNFGYLKVVEDHVLSYTGDANRPEIHKFCSDEIVQAVKLKKAIEESITTLEKEIKYFKEHNNQGHHHQETWIGLLKQLMEESKK